MNTRIRFEGRVSKSGSKLYIRIPKRIADRVKVGERYLVTLEKLQG